MRWKRRARQDRLHATMPRQAACDHAAVSFLITPVAARRSVMLWGELLAKSKLLATRFSALQFWLLEPFVLE
eukprot:8062294-Pyramimonas_sp.AAC.1